MGGKEGREVGQGKQREAAASRIAVTFGDGCCGGAPAAAANVRGATALPLPPALLFSLPLSLPLSVVGGVGVGGSKDATSSTSKRPWLGPRDSHPRQPTSGFSYCDAAAWSGRVAQAMTS